MAADLYKILRKTLLVITVFVSTNVSAVPLPAGSYLIGSTHLSPYNKLTNIINYINANGVMGSVVLLLDDATYSSPSETYPITINSTGFTTINNLTIRPATGVNVTVLGNKNDDLLKLDKADYVTIDGINSGGSSLKFENQSTGTSASTVALINGARFNVFKNLDILGSGTSITDGTIFFGTASAGNGNSNNIITNCNIGSSGSNLPFNAIFARGSYTSAAVFNNSNIISNNNISNFFNATGPTAGIYVSFGCNDWTVSGNKIFQTATRKFTTIANSRYSGIKIEDGKNYTSPVITIRAYHEIVNNIIGFASAAATGVTNITGIGLGQDFDFNGIEIVSVDDRNAYPTSIQGNIISGITINTTRSTTNSFNSPFTGIMAGNFKFGRYNIGTVTGNTIGSLDGSSGIIVNSSCVDSGSATITAILDGSLSSNTISNNKIGAITIQGTGSAMGFRGINASALGQTTTISNNIIGGPTSAGGIVDNLAGNYVMYAIQTTGSSLIAKNNIIRNITGNGQSNGLVCLSAIQIYNSAGGYTYNEVSGNEVYALTNNPGSNNSSIYAIDLNMSYTLPAINLVEKNIVHSLEILNNPAVQAVGIFNRGGSATYRNNVVRLGIDKNGNSITLGTAFFGMWIANNFSYNKYFHNTSYIGGKGVVGSSLTSAFVATVSNGIVRYMYNNNFVNTREDPTFSAPNIAIYDETTGTPTALQSNYNNYYAAGPTNYTGILGGAVKTSLQAWNAASGLDAISVDWDPKFVNPDGAAGSFSLNIKTGSVCNNEGVALGGSDAVKFDYNGLARDYATLPVPTPDIGAYELTRGTIPGTWIGVIDNDWNKTGNWENGIVPTNSLDAYIARGHKTFAVNTDLPIMPTGSIALCKDLNLLIRPSYLTVNTDGLMKVSGNFLNRGVMDFEDGTLELNGSSTQQIWGNLFKNHNVKGVIVNNNTNVITSDGLNLDPLIDTLIINGSLSFKGSNRTIKSRSVADPSFSFITLASNVGRTAFVADITNAGTNSGNALKGNYIIERYLRAVKAWRFLATPVKIATSPTVTAAWREAGITGSTGFGTQITGPAGYLGIDQVTISGSLKSYSPGSNTWVYVTNTANTLANNEGYMTFVRGDRAVAVGGTTSATNLRIKGEVRQDDQSYTVQPGKFLSIGNPYPAEVNFKTVTKTFVANQYINWNPQSTGLYGVGAYETIKEVSGVYTNLTTLVPDVRIQSGQAIFVQNNSVNPADIGNVTFKETDKSSGSTLVSRGGSGGEEAVLFIRLGAKDAADSVYEADGAVAIFGQNFSNAIDNDDAVKFLNSQDNFCIKQDNKWLSAQSRPEVQDGDSIKLYLAQTRTDNYRITTIPVAMNRNGMQAFLADKFLDQLYPISLEDTSRYNFSITDEAGSKATDRFYITFKQSNALPVTITGIQARRNSEKTIDVLWQVENELQIEKYEVERSKDGNTFLPIIRTDAQGQNTGRASYAKIDAQPLPNDNFYRVKAYSTSGAVQYSSIVKVADISKEPSLTISPNPVQQQLLQFNMQQMPVGKYEVKIVNTVAQVVYKNSIEINNVTNYKSIQLNVAKGVYQLLLSGFDGKQYTERFVIE